MRLLKLFPHLLIALLLAVPPSFALNFPLSDTSAALPISSANVTMPPWVNSLLATPSICPPQKWALTSPMSFSSLPSHKWCCTPAARVFIVRSKPRSTVARNSPQSMSPSTFTSLRLTAPMSLPAQAATTTRMRGSNFWHDLKFHVFDGDVLREPASIYGEPL